MTRPNAPTVREIRQQKQSAANYEKQRQNAAIYHAISEIVPSYDTPVSYAGLILNNAVVSKIVEEHVEGWFMNSGRLSDAVRTDSRISSAMDTGFSNVAQILLDPAQQKWTPARLKCGLSQEALEYFQDHFFQDIMTFSVLQDVYDDTEMMGFYLGQLKWKRWQPTIERWHPALSYYNRSERNFRLYSMNKSGEAIEPGTGKWLVYSPYSVYGSWLKAGISRLARMFLLKLYCLRDWGRYTTVYGNQIKALSIPYSMEPGQDRAIIQSLQNVQAEPVIPLYKGQQRDQNWELNLIGPAPGTADVFSKQMEYLDREITIYLLGQDSSTHMTGGAYNAVSSVWDATTLGKARVRILGLTLQCFPQVIKSISRLLFGTDKVAPTLTVSSDPIQYQTQSSHKDQAQGAKTGGGKPPAGGDAMVGADPMDKNA